MLRIDLIIEQDEEDPEASEVLVDGAIAGKKYRFLLDTGAAKSSVAFDHFTSLYESIDKNNSASVFAESSDDIIVIPHIEIGPISKRNFPITRMKKGSETRNLIGMDLLKDYCCHFQFDKSRVLVDTEHTKSTDHNEQTLTLDSRFHPYVDIKIGNVVAEAVWDTGAGMTVVDTGFIEKHSFLFQEAGSSIGTDAAGSQMETPMFIMEAPMIGGHKFSKCKVAGVDLSHVNSRIEIPMDLILGYNVLNNANWLLDFPGEKWGITAMLTKG